VLVGKTQCAIAGGGPAGLMLGYLLARAGVDIIVLEKHADFLRDFRGDTIHPSTLEVMHELGLLDELLKRPHQEVRQLAGEIGRTTITVADLTHLPTRCKFVAFMPQWDFLDFIAEKARRFPAFHLEMRAPVTDLVTDDGRVAGVVVDTPAGRREIRADLVVGADGRGSIVRERAGLTVDDIGAPIDVLWMRISRRAADPGQTFGHVEAGAIFVMIARDEYWQCGYVIAKGGFEDIRARGIEAFRARIASIAPFLHDRVGELRGWDDVKLLTVKIDRLRQWWRPGLLCIGDAAHAMSPVGGVGINLAIQDAVAAANLLARPLVHGRCSAADLRRVQRRREFPTRATQWLQVEIQKRVIFPTLGRTRPVTVPWLLKLVERFPILRRIPARIVGIGFRPEHVHLYDRPSGDG
jgi:2-polyprenyl-6-methoxyphenol hydroxylase-like FAD-dependent oxidoreductase